MKGVRSPSSADAAMSVRAHQEAVQASSPNRKKNLKNLGILGSTSGSSFLLDASGFHGGSGGSGGSGGLSSPSGKAVKKIRLRWEHETNQLSSTKANSDASSSSSSMSGGGGDTNKGAAKGKTKSSPSATTEGSSEFEGWRALFDEADSDGDGKLELRDVHRLLRRTLRLPPSELPQKQIDDLFLLLNANASGLLSFEDMEMLFSGELVSQ